MTRLKPPDVKALIMAHIAAELGEPAVSSRPDDGTTRFVRVIATGGAGRTDRIMQHVQLTIDCYAESVGRAYQLAADVDSLMHDLPSSVVPVVGVQSNTPAENPDPDTGSARYTTTYQLKCLVR